MTSRQIFLSSRKGVLNKLLFKINAVVQNSSMYYNTNISKDDESD